MQSLSELALELETGTILLRGRSVACRAVSALQSARLSRLFPRPVPPMVADPNAGSLAPKIPDPTDPGHRSRMAEWEDRRMALEVALSMVDIDEKSDVEFAKSLTTDADVLQRACTRIEITRMWSQMFKIGNADDSAARTALVVDASTELVSIRPDPIPERYAETVQCAKLRIAERFGQDPTRFCDESLTPGWVKVLLVYEQLRRKEESA